MSRYHCRINMQNKSDSHVLILEQIKPGSTVLEIGCAKGEMTQYMKESLHCAVSIIEQNAEDFSLAMQYAEKGFCGNVEEDVWQSHFQKDFFDYIVFADVLEHLKDPKSVIQKVSPFLKEEGSLLLSAPNITHNSIIINLLQEDFPYRETGLLDKTHVHFFAYQSLLNLIQECGYTVVSEKAVFAPEENTEFQNSLSSLPSSLATSLSNREMGNLYQFIFRAVKYAVPEEEKEKLFLSSFKTCLYFDIGEGFCEEESYTMFFSWNTKKIEISYPLSGKEKQIRFDPIEQAHGVVYDLSATVGDKPLSIRSTNGLNLMDGYYTFSEKDPWIVFDLLEKTQEGALLTISCKIEIDEFSTGLAEALAKQYQIKSLFSIKQIIKQKLSFLRKKLGQNKLVSLLFLGLRSLFQYGFRYTFHRAKNLLASQKKLSQKNTSNIPLKQQKAYRFSENYKINIVVFLEKGKESSLQALLASLKAQTYQNYQVFLFSEQDTEKTDDFDGIVLKNLQELSAKPGEYLLFLYETDILTPDALFEYCFAIQNTNADFLYCDSEVIRKDGSKKNVYKPDFSPDYLRSMNYILSGALYRKRVFQEIEIDDLLLSIWNYDFHLKVSEKAKRFSHIPKILCSSREKITAQEEHNLEKLALEQHFKRSHLEASVLELPKPVFGLHRISYAFQEQAKISIIIPNRNHVKDLKRCIDSILERSTYKNFELIIVENNSTQAEVFEYYRTLADYDKIRVLTYETTEFNYSKINNFAVSYAKGDYYIFMNNDMEVIDPSWMEELLGYAGREEVGIVGVKLLYEDGSIQHGGAVIMPSGGAIHMNWHLEKDNPGYENRLIVSQNLSAVTAACIMIRSKLYQILGGFSEDLAVAYNDMDLCMHVRSKGYLIVWTPFARLYHLESLTRGLDNTPEKKARCQKENDIFIERWHSYFEKGDPYYNCNFVQTNGNFEIKE